MSKRNHAMPTPLADTTTEHVSGDPIYQSVCQDMIDQSQYAGTAPPCFPSKVVVHHMESSDDVRHIYKSDKKD